MINQMRILKKRLKIPKGNQKPLIEDGQTLQWPTGKGQIDKQ